MSNPEITLDTLKTLKTLLDKATPGEWGDIWSVADNEIQLMLKDGNHKPMTGDDMLFLFEFRNNAEELLRLAEIGKRAEAGMSQEAKAQFVHAVKGIGECPSHNCLICSKLAKSTADYIENVLIEKAPSL